MYKTVRHGEASLQYTILPQNEDGGATSSKKKQNKKKKTVTIFYVTLMLVCGVIASAILVPLLLTSDLTTIPAAFQKFSVSSLHRTHSGNRIVVVAKKPPGWDGLHHTTQTNLINNTTTSITMTTKASVVVQEQRTTSEVTTPTPTAKSTIPGVNTTSFHSTFPSITEGSKRKYTIGRETQNSKLEQTIDSMTPIEVDLINTATTTTPWYRLKPLEWSIKGKQQKLLLSVICGGIVLTFGIIMIVIIWLKRRRMRRSRTIMEKLTDDAQKADKMTLLTEPTHSEDEQ